MCANSENKIKMRTRSSSSSSSPRSVLISKNSNKKSVPNEHQQSSKSKPLAKKARKHKFLSDLRRELSKNDTRDDQRRSNDDDDDQLLINLFPLHPKRSLVKESDKNKNNHSTKDLQHEEDHSNTVVTYNFFENTNDCGAASLTGLLWDSIVDKQCSMKQEESFSPQSLTYNFQGEGSDGIDGDSLLLRTALRQKEREIDSSTTEEKWVYYSEVVEKKEEEEDMSPSICTPDSGRNHYQQHLSNQISPRLSLKLDYEEILNAWSDKGSLYIGGDCSSSQIVPDILDDPLTPDSINNVMYGDAAGNMLWKVPEHHLRHDEAQSSDGRREDHSKMMEERGARVLRYKEKRQNRLFSKRIRYEVRKLNAEKRPRMKGRFVKQQLLYSATLVV